MTVSRAHRPLGRWQATSSRHGRDQHDRPRADLRRVSCAALETRHSFQPQHPAADVLTSAPGRRKTLRAKRKEPLNSWDARWCSVRTTDESRSGVSSVSSGSMGPARRRSRRRGLRFGEVPVRRAGRLKRPGPDRPQATTWVPDARLRRRPRCANPSRWSEARQPRRRRPSRSAPRCRLPRVSAPSPLRPETG